MRLAYIISAYKRPEQLVRLVRRLDHKAVSFFIHVDEKTDAKTYAAMTGPLSGCDNVMFLDRHHCHWGDFGHVLATLKGIKEIKRSGGSFDYVILLTGQDYPIKSNARILDFFRESNNKSYISSSPMPCDCWAGNGGMDRILYWHVRWSGRELMLPVEFPFRIPLLPRLWSRAIRALRVQRRWPANLKPFGGDSYWGLSRECVDYIHEFVQKNAVFVRYFKYVRIPDEIFFQTILLNSPLKESLVNDNLLFIDWENANPTPPAVLGIEYLERLMGSNKLFARKFDIEVDAEILDKIDCAIS